MRTREKTVLFGAWGFLSIGIFSLAIGIPGTVNELRLRSDGVIIQARVTDWRVHQGKYGTSYDVQYAFVVPGKSEPHTASGTFPFWRQDLWPSIPRPLWEKTKNTRVLDVRYLPAAPETNRPEASPSLTDALAAILVGIVSCAMAFSFFWAVRRGWKN